jgi:glycosyltransferase involved in cell wall biosynthesis
MKDMGVSLNNISPKERENAVMGTISVIIPISERYDDIEEIYQEYKLAFTQANIPVEMIFVVDGDMDGVYQTLKTLKNRGENLTIIKHARRFGESAAIMNGFKVSSGGLIMTLPAYRQVEATELPKLIGELDNCDMVVVRRWPRGDSWLNQMQTKIFHRMVRFLAGEVSRDIGCSVRIFKRGILQEINLYGDMHRFLPVLSIRQGFRIKEIDLKQSSRERHVRTYPLGIYLRRVIDLLTVFFLIKFTRKPLRFFGLTGTSVLLMGMAITIYLIIARLFYGVGLSDRPLFLVGILFLVLGIQIFAIGLIGEIIIFTHVKEIKEYIVEETIN